MAKKVNPLYPDWELTIATSLTYPQAAMVELRTHVPQDQISEDSYERLQAALQGIFHG